MKISLCFFTVWALVLAGILVQCRTSYRGTGGGYQMGTIAEHAKRSNEIGSNLPDSEEDNDEDDEVHFENDAKDDENAEDSKEGPENDRGSRIAPPDKTGSPKYYELYLDSGHRLHLMWSVDYEKSEVLMEVHAFTEINHWVAIGFSDYGEVTGADLCVLWWDEWSKAHFQDTWTDEDGVLHLDRKQDCKLSRLQRKDDKVIYMYRRKFDTCDDDHDYVIDDGTAHILFATQQGPISTLRGISIEKSQHGFQRAQMLKTESKPVKFPKDVQTFSVLANEAHVPGVETTYWCRMVKLPKMSSKQHIVQFEAVIQPGHETLVHHIEVYHCELEKGQKVPHYDGPCSASAKPPQLEPCKKVIAAWAMGASPFTYPEEAGLPIGGHGYSPYALLEIHYNNEDMRDDYVDNSGVRFYYTSHLRRHDAAVLEIGLEYTPKMAIPPQQEEFVLSGHCIVECTQVALPPDGIIFFAAQLHTHLTGKKVVARHYRGGMELAEIGRDNHYSPHFQEIRHLKIPALILPGDALVTSCHYNTMERENITLGGLSIKNEMCVSYIHYYPKSYLEVCKSSIDTDVLNNYFQFMNQFEEQPTSPDKTVGENYHAIDWTPLRATTLHMMYDSATLSMQCNKSSGDRFAGYWNNMPQTKVFLPLAEKPRLCSTDATYIAEGEDE